MSSDKELSISRQLPTILNGMNVDEVMDNLWMEVGKEIILPDGHIIHDVRSLNIKNKLLRDEWADPSQTLNLLVDTIRNPDYIHFIAKYFLNIDLLPFQCVILSMFWNKPLPMLIMTRGGGKSYLLALYIVLRCILHQGCRICVVGASLRQSMVLFNYVQQIWEASPILQDIAGGKNKAPKRDQHICYWNCGDSRAVFLPLGSGEKIRGQRANIIICDEFGCLDFNTLVETDKGLLRIGESESLGFKCINSNGNLEQPEKFIKTPFTDSYKITTKYGYSFTCSNKHKVKTLDGWKLAKDLTSTDYIVCENKYEFPQEEIQDVTKEKSYELGLSINDLDSVPWYILQSPKHIVQSFIDGVFQDTSSIILFNETLADDIQTILLKFDIYTNKQQIKNRWIIELLDEPLMDDSLQVDSVQLLDEQRHLYDFYLPETHSFYGNGFVQHNSVPAEVFETVVRGFAAVKSDGLYLNVSRAYKQSVLKHFGKEAEKDFVEEGEDWERKFSTVPTMLDSNQIILSGTAYYQFNHFYKYYQYYKGIITSGGDFEKLKREFPDRPPPVDLDPSQYAIIRVPYTMVPPGMMDMTILNQGKATMDPQIFDMEYNTCLGPDTDIITYHGLKKITDIKIGDLVLTHKGRWKPVTKKYYNKYKGQIINLSTYGCYKNILVTPNHPFLQNNEWIQIGDVKKYTELKCLKELSNKKDIYVSDFVNDFVINNDYIYPKSSQNTMTNDEIQDIKTSNLSINELAEKYNVLYSKIWAIQNNNRKPKNSIPDRIPLNYDFGLILGYYASEGSTGSKGKSVHFSLDGHKDLALEDIVQELCGAIERTFKIKPKRYRPEDNLINITLNSRIIVDLMKSICPGICYDKKINPDILFSNKDLLKGFIVGYWHGDGCIHRQKRALATSCSLELMMQVKLALLYFNIGGSLTIKNAGTSIIRDKTYQTQDSYIYTINGLNFINFMKLFNIEIDAKTRMNPFIKINEGTVGYQIQRKELRDYDDYVYNLEVEDDHSYSLLNATVHNCFPSDSEGFYLASCLNACTCPLSHPVAGNINYAPKLYGDKDKKYIMGIDPASEHDNFAINIIEDNDVWRGVVYQWSTNRKDFEELRRNGFIREDIVDYNTFIITHIRDLRRRFNVELIVMDAAGGGVSIKEGLRDPSKLLDSSDELLLDLQDEEMRGIAGQHILLMIEFSNYKWRRDAHHALRKDFLDKKLLFPNYDPAHLTIQTYEDTAAGKFFDTVEDCHVEIEQCKQETTLIQHSETVTGQEKWDVPKVIGVDAEQMKKLLKRDRFSSLLLANWGCRWLQSEGKDHTPAEQFGGLARQWQGGGDHSGPRFVGPGANKLRNLPSFKMGDDGHVVSQSNPNRRIFF